MSISRGVLIDAISLASQQKQYEDYKELLTLYYNAISKICDCDDKYIVDVSLNTISSGALEFIRQSEESA